MRLLWLGLDYDDGELARLLDYDSGEMAGRVDYDSGEMVRFVDCDGGRGQGLEIMARGMDWEC